MSQFIAAMHDHKRRIGTPILILLAVFFAAVTQPSPTRSDNPAKVFELELPELHVGPSTNPEIIVPSANINQVFVHILKPVADETDYGAISASVNGQAAAIISEIVNGARGKVVKINLNLRPGFNFVTGRNTIEVTAHNRRGRSYYASFVIQTALANWNQDFIYQVEDVPESKNNLAPQLVVLEPEKSIEFPAGVNEVNVKIKGIASAITGIKRVSINEKDVRFTAVSEVSTRQITRIPNSKNNVAFEAVTVVNRAQTEVKVEAEDSSGIRSRVLVPVIVATAIKPAPPAGRRYALVIGISKYQNNLHGIPNLDYADADARALYEFLQQPQAGSFAREDMLILTNEQATLVRVRQALSSFVAAASTDDLLLIFFAGHGAPDPYAQQNLYVIAYDTDVSDMSHTALPMSELRRFVEQNVRSKRVVLLLDTCHSAGLSGETTRDLGNNLTNLYLEKLLYSEAGRAIITSSDVNELSRESSRWGNGHGVFTYHLLEGLRGRADANHDHLVTVGELFRYVRQRVRLDTEFHQNPRMLVGDNENLALAVAR